MRNLTKPSEKIQEIDSKKDSSVFDTNSHALSLKNADGEQVLIHVGIDGFLYINGVPFGVAGMPPAPHKQSHAINGDDFLSPADIGAVDSTLLTAVPKANSVPVLDNNGLLNAEFLDLLIAPKAHAENHAKGGSDEITPLSIGAVASDDSRLSDSRTPTSHKSSHGKDGTDRILPRDIGAVDESDSRLTDDRFPTSHNHTHFKNGDDPLSWFDVGSVNADMFTMRERVPFGYPQLNDLGFINQNLLPTTLAPGAHKATHELGGNDQLGLDGTQITSGTIDLARLPKAAINNLFQVPDLATMFTLTKTQVQNGDTVQTLDTMIMYAVVDDNQLTTMAGYQEYSAGRASTVPWSGVQDKPNTFTPSLHASSHALGGLDELTPESIGTLSSEQIQTLLQGYAVKNHASVETSYGVGTATNYGHVKTSDSVKSTRVNAEVLTSYGGYLIQQGIQDVADDLADYETSNNAEITALKNKNTTLEAEITEIKATLENTVQSSNVATITQHFEANKGNYLTFSLKG